MKKEIKVYMAKVMRLFSWKEIKSKIQKNLGRNLKSVEFKEEPRESSWDFKKRIRDSQCEVGLKDLRGSAGMLVTSYDNVPDLKDDYRTARPKENAEGSIPSEQ